MALKSLFPQPKYQRPSNTVQSIASAPDPYRRTSTATTAPTTSPWRYAPDSWKATTRGDAQLGGMTSAIPPLQPYTMPVFPQPAPAMPSLQPYPMPVPTPTVPSPQPRAQPMFSQLPPGTPAALWGRSALSHLVSGGVSPGVLAEALGQYGTGTNLLDDIFGIITSAQPLPQAEPSPTSDAARLLASAFGENPFINVKGLSQLQRGYAPLMGQIDPAFWRQTSPVLQQSLLGLYSAMGMRPEDVLFAQQQARVPGLRD